METQMAKEIKIETVDNFITFCKIYYGQEKQAKFKNKWEISIEGQYFKEWNRLVNYLARFEAADNETEKGGDRVSHVKFLNNITFNINIEIWNSDEHKRDYKHINRVFNELTQNLVKFKFDKCIWDFRIHFMNKVTAYDFDFITGFENEYENFFSEKLKPYYLVSKSATYASNINVYNFNLNKYNNNKDDKEFHFTEQSGLGSLTYQLLACLKDNIHINVINIANGDIKRIPTYFSAVISGKLWVICNNIILRPQMIEDFGALAPALFVTDKNLSLLQRPIPYTIWQIIINNRIDTEDLASYTNLKAYLQICYKNLFCEFKHNESQAYTKLRKAAYSSNDFKEYIINIPFLALLIFSMYDGSYRNDLLQYAKSEDYYDVIHRKEFSRELGKKSDKGSEGRRLTKADLLLEDQGNQDYEMYKKYKDAKQKTGYDIKNLLTHYDENYNKSDDKTEVNPEDNKSEISPVVVSEIFECVSIAEGLLQILENAVYHAGGGLLSLRTYSRATKHTSDERQKENNVKYLNREYSEEYFALDGVEKTNYFLEVQVSDLSNESIPIKFMHNYGISSEIKLNYFFKPTVDDINTKIKFFENPINLAFHYGLEIFTKIVESRKGVFAVCGYKDEPDKYYSNVDDLFAKSIDEEKRVEKEFLNKFNAEIKESKSKLANQVKKIRENITRNADIHGTTYRILLPLNHTLKDTTNFASNEVAVTINDDSIDDIKVVFIPGNKKDQANFYDKFRHSKDSGKSYGQTSKENEAQRFSDALMKCFNGGNQIKSICLDVNKLIMELKWSVEEIVKGCVLFAIKEISDEQGKEPPDFILPIAMVNMTRVQLLEASRILGVFYSNLTIFNSHRGETDCQGIDIPYLVAHLQIYLKSDDTDLIFAGKDIKEVRLRLVKMAMANGTMNDDMVIVDQLLRGVTLNEG